MIRILAVAALSWVALAASCVPPPRMCAQESDCGSQASCVAGRCVAHGATPAIDTARRLLFAPEDIGYVRRGESTRAGALATFGRAGDPSVAFLRFSVPLAPEANVLEAYVLLERATSVDADEVPIALHVVRVATPWDGRTLSWASQPHVEEMERARHARLGVAAGPLVRIDVRDLVQRAGASEDGASWVWPS